MKKIGIFFIFLLILLLSATATLSPTEQKLSSDETFRLHVRANSNDFSDQEVKMKVKEEICALLAPIFEGCENKADALKRAEGALEKIERAANEVLKREGFSYGARAKITLETFPTRVYENFTLPAGEYDALVLSLGSGEGDNWWCVLFPTLCFSGSNKVVYKWKIKEWWNSLFS